MTGFPINPPRTAIGRVNNVPVTIAPEWWRYFLEIQKLIGGPSDPFDDSMLLSSSSTAMGLDAPQNVLPIVFQLDPGTLTAGAGLTGGGNMGGNVGLAVGAGTGITVGADSVGLTLETAAGTYTPTLTNVANLDASTAYSCQYLQIGSVVTVSGRVDIDPTAAAAATQLGISLPIASNLANANECAGTAAAFGVAGQVAAIMGDATNDRAEMRWVSGDVTNMGMMFSFQYRIA